MRERELEVAAHRHVRVERVVLEDHRDVALLRRELVDDAVADPDRPARHRLEAGEKPEQRRLAAARRADEDHQLAVLDVEIDVDERATWPPGTPCGRARNRRSPSVARSVEEVSRRRAPAARAWRSGPTRSAAGSHARASGSRARSAPSIGPARDSCRRRAPNSGSTES